MVVTMIALEHCRDDGRTGAWWVLYSHSTMVVTGDPAQSDLLPELSGLSTAAERLEKLGGASVIRLVGQDVVRHPLVAEMLDVL